MGTASTPRHRADVSRGPRWADLRRVAARLLAGRDLYADDLVLREGAALEAVEQGGQTMRTRRSVSAAASTTTS